MSPVRYELGFFIAEDCILHSHRRESLKCYIYKSQPAVWASDALSAYCCTRCPWKDIQVPTASQGTHGTEESSSLSEQVAVMYGFCVCWPASLSLLAHSCSQSVAVDSLQHSLV
jgi:hypothetical protein